MTAGASDIEELRVDFERLRELLESLVVRGLRACGPDELSKLRNHAEHLEKAGAGHSAAVLNDLRTGIEADGAGTTRKLVEAQTNVRLLERLLTLRVVQGWYAGAIETGANPEAGEGDEASRKTGLVDGVAGSQASHAKAAGSSRPPMPFAEVQSLRKLLAELRKGVEELLSAGMTAASKATIARLDVSFKEASRLKLLRLGSTLRIANEEIARFASGSPLFSARRLSFFLGRAWLLATALELAVAKRDEAALATLLATPRTEPVAELFAVVLGVAKRVVPGAFASFDFRLRATRESGPVQNRESLVWSCVFPLRKDLDLPAEAFLHLPQKQKFKPSLLLEKREIRMTGCAVSRQPGVATRVSLSETGTVTTLEPYGDWASLWGWNLGRAAARLESHRPGPMDLDIELQEEVFVDEWRTGAARTHDDGHKLVPVETPSLPFEMRIETGPSGVPLAGVMEKLADEKMRPPLYGLAHYEACRIVLQPLSALGVGGVEYLTLSADKISQAELVKAMKFT
jgi:hypothetical protein